MFWSVRIQLSVSDTNVAYFPSFLAAFQTIRRALLWSLHAKLGAFLLKYFQRKGEHEGDA